MIPKKDVEIMLTYEQSEKRYKSIEKLDND